MMCESIEINEAIRGRSYCWKCRTTEVEVNATDSIYRLQCNDCYESRKNKWSLKWMSARKNELVRCQFCSDAYTFKKKSEVHKCPTVGVSQCRLCAYQLNSCKSLKVHLKVAHGLKESNLKDSSSKKRFECSICKKSYARSRDFKVHLRNHTGEKPFECNICKKAFTRSGDLKIHIRTHTGEKPFKCNICCKAFARSWVLKCHLSTHTGEKPFECKICSRAFAWLGDLKVHLKIHTADKSFKCDICEKAFVQSGQLKVHLRTHTGEKPYECNICKRAFSHSWSRKKHLEMHNRGPSIFKINNY